MGTVFPAKFKLFFSNLAVWNAFGAFCFSPDKEGNSRVFPWRFTEGDFPLLFPYFYSEVDKFGKKYFFFVQSRDAIWETKKTLGEIGRRRWLAIVFVYGKSRVLAKLSTKIHAWKSISFRQSLR